MNNFLDKKTENMKLEIFENYLSKIFHKQEELEPDFFNSLDHELNQEWEDSLINNIKNNNYLCDSIQQEESEKQDNNIKFMDNFIWKFAVADLGIFLFILFYSAFFVYQKFNINTNNNQDYISEYSNYINSHSQVYELDQVISK